MNIEKANSLQRFKSIFFDLILLIIISVPLVVTILFFRFDDNLLYQTFILSVLYTCLLSKDLIGGQSIGKRICKLQIVNVDNSSASSLKLILRNVLFLIWPIEFIIILINPERRFGDLLFNTKVIPCKKNSGVKQKNIYYTFLVVLIIVFILFYFVIKVLYAYSNLIKLLYT
ncbi:RDD family protein [Dysgonomonas sp. ZJ279]|uniref:RDD family protein n=1 Tax=Dysgonomonas sp. ZJ279 TaxID=2709796 RepID=UPI0013EAFD60